ncbi:serine hydrolase [Gallaecimonas xiamenensis]|uniref:Beta-lactamase n=1 Tax=Gallaecimonas xiamenensis 3-C-1 TaxID=745411 RepID=K2JSU4_9GAMM|nr:serine hydrolase [Gallaecimonas xiamenensis]EKE77582.1 beta-lactamase [Gallaecimonas xiamenensis 3-C-1]
MKKLWLLVGVLALPAKAMDSESLDALARQAQQRFAIPGLAVGVVQGDFRYQGSFGEAQPGHKVDGQTLFKLASTTKAFTTTTLALLVEQGKLAWDDPVVRYLPDFAMYDPWVTKQLQVKDLLVHNSGLGLGQGDLMLWPEPNSFSRAEVVHNLRHLKPASSFRSSYAYDNLLYVVAGELIAKVTGQPWEYAVQQRLLKPLGMDQCFTGPVPPANKAQLAWPHLGIERLPKADAADHSLISAAAGGIRCSLGAMMKWLDFHLAAQAGKSPLLGRGQHNFLWTPQTLMTVGEWDRQWDNSHFAAYGLGWRMKDMDGLLLVHHTGTLAGMRAAVAFLPEKQLGVVVLMNADSSDGRDALVRAILKSALGGDGKAWLARYPAVTKTKARAKVDVDPGQPLAPAQLKAQLGTWQDPWFGKVQLKAEGDKVLWQSERSERLSGVLYPAQEGYYLLRWQDRTLEADASLWFEDGHMKLAPASPEVDFSFDFGDLDLQREP